MSVLREADGPIRLDLRGYLNSRERDTQKRYPLRMYVLAPGGGVVLDREFSAAQRTWKAHNLHRVAPRPWLKATLAGDGRKGVYRVIVESRQIDFGLFLPVSDAKEVVPINLGGNGQLMLHAGGCMATFPLPKGVRRPILDIHSASTIPQSVEIRVADARPAQKVYVQGLWAQANVRRVALKPPAEDTSATVYSGIAHGLGVRFVGDWKPAYYSVWPGRFFLLERHGEPVRRKP